MPYSVLLTKTAQRDIQSLTQEVRTAILDLIKDFENYPDTRKESEAVSGYEARKLRSGNHRIVFTVNSSRQQVVVHLIRTHIEMYTRLAKILG